MVTASGAKSVSTVAKCVRCDCMHCVFGVTLKLNQFCFWRIKILIWGCENIASIWCMNCMNHCVKPCMNHCVKLCKALGRVYASFSGILALTNEFDDPFMMRQAKADKMLWKGWWDSLNENFLMSSSNLSMKSWLTESLNSRRRKGPKFNCDCF